MLSCHLSIARLFNSVSKLSLTPQYYLKEGGLCVVGSSSFCKTPTTTTTAHGYAGHAKLRGKKDPFSPLFSLLLPIMLVSWLDPIAADK